jgi:2-methylcitrate dehydratase PrpD
MESLKSGTMSEALANYVCNLRISDLPDEVIEKAEISILDAMGCAFAGSKLQVSQISLNIFKKFSGEGKSTLWLNGKRADMLNTAWANCVLVHSALQDDWQASVPNLGHMGSIIIPTAFAVAEMENKTGAELITAIVAAYEVAARIASHSGPKIIGRGFRGSPVFGTFASATASGKLLGLNKKGLKNAICCAASFSGGILEPCIKGTMEWRYQNGNSLRGGMIAALLASEGLDSADTALEGEYGFFSAFGGKDLLTEIDKNMTEVLASLGKDYVINRNIFKPFTTCGDNQTGVDIVIDLVKKNDLGPKDIKMVKVQVSPGNKAYPGVVNQGPFNSFDKALFSKPFSIAAAIKYRDLKVDTYLENMGDPDIAELARKVVIDAVPGMDSFECRVELSLNDGRKFNGDSNAVDMLNYRLDKRRALEKFVKRSSSLLNKEKASKIGEYIFELTKKSDLSELSALLHGEGGF